MSSTPMVTISRLQFHLRAVERVFVGEGFLGRKVGEARVFAKQAQDGIDPLTRSSDSAVNPLGREQQSAAHVVG